MFFFYIMNLHYYKTKTFLSSISLTNFSKTPTTLFDLLYQNYLSTITIFQKKKTKTILNSHNAPTEINISIDTKQSLIRNESRLIHHTTRDSNWFN